jgi:hypothetical protein
MPPLLMAFIVGVSATTWVYIKEFRRTGGNTKSSATVASGAGLLLFLICLAIFSSIF